MKIIFLITALLSTCLAQAPCGNACSFRFCNADGLDTRIRPNPRLLVRDPDIATFPFVCTRRRRGPQISRVIKTGEAMVAPLIPKPLNFIPISSYPAGPRQFRKGFFRLKKLDFPPLPGRFGIARRQSPSKLESSLENLCVRLPLIRYRIVDRDGIEKTIRSTKRSDCVSFLAVRSFIIVELTWDSPDDLDIRLTEPDGNVINRFRPNSATGGRLLPSSVGACGVQIMGREQVTYRLRATPLNGDYTVELRHFQNCASSSAPTNWNLAVIQDSVNVLNEKGTSDMGGNAVIDTFTFRFPA